MPGRGDPGEGKVAGKQALPSRELDHVLGILMKGWMGKEKSHS